jgi:FAD/FMN-containing dehydrogenase
VPLRALPGFLEQAQALADHVILFGHLGDGNVHVNVLGLDPDDTAADDAVLELVLRHGGTISAEHGIGIAKAAWLKRARGTGDYAAMCAIKRALDPANLLNPGVVLERDEARAVQPSSSTRSAIESTTRAGR